MPDYKEEDEEIKEAYEEYQALREAQTKQSPRNVIQNIPQKFWIGLAIIISFLGYLTFIRESLPQSTFFWFVIGALILIIVLSTQKEGEARRLIPEQQLKSILYVKLKEKQRISPTEVPMGDISVLLPCKLKKIEGTPTKYVLSFKVTTPSGYEKFYTAEMNPYDGYLMGFEERPAGFRGVEVSDVKFIRHREDQWADRYDKGKSN